MMRMTRRLSPLSWLAFVLVLVLAAPACVVEIHTPDGGGDGLSGTPCATNADCAELEAGACEKWLCAPVEEVCAKVSLDGEPCDDGDACTSEDVCADATCGGAAVACDDEDACTTDTCDEATGCHHAPIAPCDDGDPCTTDACDPASGCQFTAHTEACDDGDPCTGGDVCADGTCAGEAIDCDDGLPCTADSCDEADGSCVHEVTDGCLIGGVCVADEAPNPANECEACLPDTSEDAWTPLADNDPCGDDPCTAGRSCQAGTCAEGSPVVCDDDQPCTFDACDPATGECVFTLVDACLIDGQCAGAGAPNPANPCQVCDPGAATDGWSDADDGTPCEDDDPCTLSDTCDAGACQPGEAKACDDGLTCTEDACDGSTGACSHTLTTGCLIQGACYAEGTKAPDNGCMACLTADATDTWSPRPDSTPCGADPCGGAEACESGVCTAGQPVVCDDGKACTHDACDPATGECVFTLVNGCLIDEQCAGAGAPNPANPCQVCDPGAATDVWTDAAGGTPCEDGDPCTVQDICTAGACAGAALVCDDDNACTTDLCEQGVCTYGPATTCDDGKPCTVDACDPFTGACSYTLTNGCVIDGGCVDAGQGQPGEPCQICWPDASTSDWSALDGLGCEDGDPCTVNDVCMTGTCQAGALKTCVDDVGCTVDACDAVTGACSNDPVDAACDDANACTTELCDPLNDCTLTPVDCPDDGEPCTLEACDPAAGCGGATMADGTECSDGDLCTIGNTCQAGVCSAGEAPNCDDGDPCTADTCDSAIGCVHTPLAEDAPDVLNLVDDDCDGQTDEDADFDHDGVADHEDLCPTVWTPDNSDRLCKPLDGDFAWQRSVDLYEPGSPDGASKGRRTHEVIEIPLANGYLDSSVLGYWPLDGDGQAKGWGLAGAVAGASPVEGPFGDAHGALAFNTGGITFQEGYPPIGSSFTFMGWVRFDHYEGDQPIVEARSGVSGGLSLSLVDGTGLTWEVLGVNDTYSFSVPVEELGQPGQWHHVASTFAGGRLDGYIDGLLVGSDNTAEFAEPVNKVFTLATGGAVGELHLVGALSDVLLHDRALSPTEVAAYVQTRTRYGTRMVPDAQADLDDVRMTEVSPYQDEHLVPHDLLGVRVHSDSPCPPDADPTTFADRDDLCGVEAYWRLDGDAKDVVSGAAGTSVNTQPEHGRFGDFSGARHFDGTAHVDTGFVLGANETAPFTVELWARVDAGGGDLFAYEHNAPWGQLRLRVYDQAGGGILMVFRDDDNNVVKLEWSGHELVGDGWHHYAVVRDTAADRVRLFLDGVQIDDDEDITVTTLNSTGLSAFLGATNKEDGTPLAAMVGALDEVLIHSVAKSPDYLYRRANPGVPVLRFLAHTEPWTTSDASPFLPYFLRWGDDAATARPPLLAHWEDPGQSCHGLLSPCIGYVGWWRFDLLRGGLAINESTLRVHGTLAGDIALAPGPVSPGASFDGDADWITVPADPYRFIGHPFTAEVSAWHPESIEGGFNTLIRHNTPGASGTGYLIYAAWDKFRSVTNEPDGAPFPAGAWGQFGVVHDGAWSQMYADGEPVEPPAAWVSNASAEPWVWLGGYDGASNNDFPGVIDHVRLSSRALSPDELLRYPAAGWLLGQQHSPAATDCGLLGEPCPDGFQCVSGWQYDYCESEDGGSVYVPAGEFWMGCNTDNAYEASVCAADEKDASGGSHLVETGAYAIQRTMVTNDDFGQCADAGCEGTCLLAEGETGPLPAACVTWYEAEAYCGWLAETSGQGWRLCSEAEWEKAARGGCETAPGLDCKASMRVYPWSSPGDTTEASCDFAWFDEPGPVGDACGQAEPYPYPAASAMPQGASPYGAVQMVGSVLEWVQDCHHTSYNGAPADGSAWMDQCFADGAKAVSRGGGWDVGADEVRAADRANQWLTASGSISFRCCRDVASAKQEEWVYFEQDGNIYRMRPDTTQTSDVVVGESQAKRAKLSPDGSWIFFAVVEPTTASDVWIARSDGAMAEQITEVGDALEMRPRAWSADGKLIYATGHPVGGGCGPCPQSEIFVIDVATGEATQLTFDSYGHENVFTTTDPNVFVYTRRQTSNDCCNATDIYRTDDGFATFGQQLTTYSDYDWAQDFHAPTGLIAYTSKTPSDDVYVMQLDGAAPIVVNDDPGSQSNLVFSPDGARLMYRDEPDGAYYTIKIDGTDKQFVMTHEEGFAVADWALVAY